MKILVLSASPNTDRLTAACARAAAEGARGAGAEAREVRINDAGIGLCKACGNGSAVSICTQASISMPEMTLF